MHTRSAKFDEITRPLFMMKMMEFGDETLVVSYLSQLLIVDALGSPKQGAEDVKF